MGITFTGNLAVPDMNSGYTTAVFANEADTAQSAYAKQRAFTGIDSGTAPSGITWHTVASPFTCTLFRPSQFQTLGPVNPVTGALRAVPRNTWRFLVRKGMVPLSGQPSATAIWDLKVSIPAGAEVADPEQIYAGHGAFVGEVYDLASEIADFFIDGNL